MNYGFPKSSALFNLRINCSSDLKQFSNCRPSAWNLQKLTISKTISPTLGQNNFSNKTRTKLLKQIGGKISELNGEKLVNFFFYKVFQRKNPLLCPII